MNADKIYYKIKMVIHDQLVSNSENKIVFLPHAEVEAVLHPAQHDNSELLKRIKDLMWKDLCTKYNLAEKGIGCEIKYTECIIPKYVEPITYKIKKKGEKHV